PSFREAPCAAILARCISPERAIRAANVKQSPVSRGKGFIFSSGGVAPRCVVPIGVLVYYKLEGRNLSPQREEVAQPSNPLRQRYGPGDCGIAPARSLNSCQSSLLSEFNRSKSSSGAKLIARRRGCRRLCAW